MSPKVIIYALHASDEPGKWRYVGRTTNAGRRLTSHNNRRTSISKAYDDWRKEVWARSARICLVVLDRVDPTNGRKAEEDWISRCRAEHTLTNVRTSRDLALLRYRRARIGCYALS
jgi:hypothetical protein